MTGFGREEGETIAPEEVGAAGDPAETEGEGEEEVVVRILSAEWKTTTETATWTTPNRTSVEQDRDSEYTLTWNESQIDVHSN